MPEHHRILLIRLSHLGDLVHALPVFHALRELWPRASIGWVAQEEFAGLLEGLPGLDRIFLFGRREGPAAWWRLRDELADFGADLAVDAQANVKSAVAGLCSGAPRRVGPHPADWRERFGATAVTETAERAESPRGGSGGDRGPHAVDRSAALVRHLGSRSPLRTDPALSGRELEGGRARWSELMGGARDGPPAVLLQLAEGSDVRSWPAGHYRALAEGLARSGVPSLLLSGPQEEGLGRALASDLARHPGLRHWVGQRGLRELAAFFAAAAERGARFAGCDSGPMHLAAACGLPVVSLAGPQSHLRTGPWPPPAPSSPHRVLRSPTSPACAPCRSRRCRHPRGPVCMADLTPGIVLKALTGR